MSIKSNHHYNIHLDSNNKDPMQLVPSNFPTRQVKKKVKAFSMWKNRTAFTLKWCPK